MMKIIIKLLLVLIISSVQVLGQNKKGFQLKGNVAGLKDGTTIYLVTHEVDTIAKVTSKGSIFNFEGYIKRDANFYFLKVDTTVFHKQFSNALWLVNGKMTVEGKVNDWRNLNLSGSEPQIVWLAFKDLQDKNLKNTDWKVMRKEFIESHLNSLFTPYLIRNSDPAEREYAYSKLSQGIKDSFYGIEAANRIDGDKKRSLLKKLVENNEPMPDFTVSNVDGKRISILAIAAKSKYTLIDFWASWCVPCRAAVPEMKRVYDTFNNKGFNIVGLSTDKSEVGWKKAIDVDKTLWDHTIDNLDHAGKNIFDLKGIPGYVLIDQKGRIIQMDIISNSDGAFKIRKEGEKSLSSDLYEIIEGLLGDGKRK